MQILGIFSSNLCVKMEEPPSELKILLENKHFCKNIRECNNSLAFASLGIEKASETSSNFKREYLVTSLIMPERHFHFLSVVADRLQDHPTAWPQLQKESECATRALLKW